MIIVVVWSLLMIVTLAFLLGVSMATNEFNSNKAKAGVLPQEKGKHE